MALRTPRARTRSFRPSHRACRVKSEPSVPSWYPSCAGGPSIKFSQRSGAAAWGRLSSRQAEVLQRSASDPASDIRLDDQFEHLNVMKVHLILFNFAYRSGWTEIPLLANNLFKCGPTMRTPPQNELLCTPNSVFLKNKGYAFEPDHATGKARFAKFNSVVACLGMRSRPGPSTESEPEV